MAKTFCSKNEKNMPKRKQKKKKKKRDRETKKENIETVQKPPVQLFVLNI